MSQYSKFTVIQLIQLCKEHGIPYSKRKKKELITSLLNIKQGEKINIKPSEYTLIDIDKIESIPRSYPEDFKIFCENNNLKPPSINSMNGNALSVMTHNPFHYWTRETCDTFVKKFNIKTKDSIQLFNKHSQWGIKTNSGIEKGKLYIVYPYSLSNKHKMRKNFNYNNANKDAEIDNIKSTIKLDYIDVPNERWQLGHKNPGITDSSMNNLVLQPPIQARYRDDYIFIDTITKIPLPNKLKSMIELNHIEFSDEQIDNYFSLFSSLKKKIDNKMKS
jgi:hypothetical protein